MKSKSIVALGLLLNLTGLTAGAASPASDAASVRASGAVEKASRHATRAIDCRTCGR